MEFKDLVPKVQEHISKMCETGLFVVEVDKDNMWNLYLDSFPEGSNEIFRTRREYDCSCCRQFIRAFGNVVTVVDNMIVTIWDVDTGSRVFNRVFSALGTFVSTYSISQPFVTNFNKFGTKISREKSEGTGVLTFHHFYAEIPKSMVYRGLTGGRISELVSNKNVLHRSLKELSRDSIETVLDLIAQKSLYRGEEWSGPLGILLKLYKQYQCFKSLRLADNFCWMQSIKVGGAISKIKNSSIGTLLTDISEGIELDLAVRKYEKIVAPTNYKRPKAIFSKKQVEEAQKFVVEQGLNLERRFAVEDDISVNDVLFMDRDKAPDGDVFGELKSEVAVNVKKFSRTESVSAEDFIANILPTATGIELLFENRHVPNLVSLIAPKTNSGPSFFKWDNQFCQVYNGNLADSMKERVKAAGGRVDGVLRFSIQWNEDGDNQNDFDAHCIEPNKNHIYYSNKRHTHRSSGKLDVDIVNPGSNVAVENIIWTDINRMCNGLYSLRVNVYSHRGGRSGFRAEVEFDDKIHSFDYTKPVKDGQTILVADVTMDENGFSIKEHIDSTQSTRTEWGIKTNQFVPVKMAMYSPNYWDKSNCSGNQHLIFMVDNCVNDSTPNGFFNEFLKEEFMKHKRVFEALGSKMKVEPSDNQLSGLGFCMTKRNDIICKVKGSFERTIKLTF